MARPHWLSNEMCDYGQLILHAFAVHVLFAWKPMRRFLMYVRARKVTFPMGAYGALTLKQTTLWGTLPNLCSLYRPLSAKLFMEALARTNTGGLVRKSVDKNGKKRVTGVKKKLAASAAYPRGFGIAIGDIIPGRGSRPDDFELDFTYPHATDDLGALDDLRKGSFRAWWRKL